MEVVRRLLGCGLHDFVEQGARGFAGGGLVGGDEGSVGDERGDVRGDAGGGLVGAGMEFGGGQAPYEHVGALVGDLVAGLVEVQDGLDPFVDVVAADRGSSQGQPYGAGHRCVPLLSSHGMLCPDIVDGRIMYVVVLDRPLMHRYRERR